MAFATINFAMASWWLIRNTLELAGVFEFSGWTNSTFHYAIGYPAASLYVAGITLLALRRKLFIFFYCAGLALRVVFWTTQAQIEGFPVQLGFIALAVDALVLMTSMRWYLRKPSQS